MVTVLFNIAILFFIIWMIVPRYKSGNVFILKGGLYEVDIIRCRNIPGWSDRIIRYTGKPGEGWFSNGESADKTEVRRINTAIAMANLLGTVQKEED